MIQIEDKIVSLDLVERYFYCDLSRCKGACCIEGDAGAPLDKGEFDILRKILPEMWDDLLPAAKEVINRQGIAYIDPENDIVTSIVDKKNCVFTYYDCDGMCRCAIEKAYREGRVSFMKPISCHLYPIRVKRYRDFYAVNYHRWKICRAAEVLGKSKNIRVYQFLQEPLIRKFGRDFYEALDACVRQYLAQK